MLWTLKRQRKFTDTKTEQLAQYCSPTLLSRYTPTS